MNMNLRYVCSNVLVEFDKDKHYGCFVYLNEDYIKEDIKIRKGLYFGGTEGWERLTDDNVILADPTSSVSLPLDNPVNWTYDTKEKTFYPLNWNDIEKFCFITGNVGINAGEYTADITLKYEGWNWSDGTSNEHGSKRLNYTIKEKDIKTISNMNVVLSKDEITYGDDFPFVILVKDITPYSFIEGDDYDVEYFGTGNVNDRNGVRLVFKNDFKGTIDKTFTVKPATIDLPQFGLDMVYGFTGSEINVVPDNWDDIKDYCNLSFSNDPINAGSYTMTVSIKQSIENNYTWSDGSKSPKIYMFNIDYVNVKVPVWIEPNFTYDGEFRSVYPDNWETIKDYCIIENNNIRDAGEYVITVGLKNESLRWDNTSHDKKPINFDFVIEQQMIDLPVWGSEIANYYSGRYYHCVPENWDYLKEYCTMTGEEEYDAGDYTTIISLRDINNYKWRKNLPNPQTRYWKILKAPGQFIIGPVINGGNDVNNTLECVAEFIDHSVDITYIWYRNETDKLDGGAVMIKSGSESTYTITPKDVNHFIICEVVAPSSDNFETCSVYKSTPLRITKIGVKYTLGFVDDLYEDTIFKSQNIYTLPGVSGIVDGDHPTIEWRVISGTDVAEMFTDTNVLVKGIGDVIFEATVSNSPTYQYIPDKIRFTLHVYDGDMMKWGMYNKDNEENELTMLQKGLVPENAIVANSKETDKGIHSLMLRSDFPMEQTYYGWYILVPINKKIEIIDENSGNVIDQNECQVFYMKNGERQEIYIDSEGRQYKVYGKFNVAKTSDNWMLHTLIKTLY
ncbi:MAG: hypothetical protein NC548_24755 [Lachnospiraceae bacterium]|nr:hypothetical protein [Lachnospiraceae bacterium]